MALLFSCGYQKNELTPIAKATDTTDILVVDIQTDSEVTIEEDDVALTKDIFDLFDIFFKKFVVVTNKNKFDTLVDYTKLHELKTKEDPNFLKLVATIEKKLESAKALENADTSKKIAFYINTYNFLAIRLINKNYIKSGKKIKSIKDLSSGLNPFEIFSRKIAKVNNKLISLDNIEKDLVLPISDNDPRLHFAVICASKGCPVTLNEAYRGEKLEKQLDFVSKSGLNLPRMFQKSGATLKISKIFEWYKKDFTNSKFKSVLGFINYFREENHKGELGSRDITLKEKKSEDQEVLSLKKGKTKVSFNTTNNLLTILERGKVLRWKELRHFRVQCR